MIELNPSNLNKLKITSRLICEEMLKRGWRVSAYSPELSYLKIKRNDGKEIEIFSATPPSTSYVAGRKAEHKFITTILYQENNLPVPKSYLASSQKEIDSGIGKILKKGKMVVIKPIDGAHGNGVSVGLTDKDDIKKAITRAKIFSETIIIQEHIDDSIDVRFSCIDYEFVAGLVRIPARVKGDGSHSIGQLIEIENKDPQRGENYMKSKNIIDVKQARIYLGEGIDTVPPKGEYVTVLGTANMATGGETVDVTDKVPDWLVKLTEKAARVSQLPVCGVDFMLSKEPDIGDEPADLNPVIIEINNGPGLFLHELPTYGKPRPVIKSYVDYLASID